MDEPENDVNEFDDPIIFMVVSTECQRWRLPYKTGKIVHVHAKHYKHNEDGRTAPDVYGNGSVPLSHSGNVVTRIGIHTHTHTHGTHL